MKTIKIISVCLVGMVAIFSAFKVSESIIENKNERYVPDNPLVLKELREDEQTYPEDIDKMISHVVPGTGETTLPVKYDQDFTIYEKNFYVTNNEGKTWLLVPDDDSLGYARISEYLDSISRSNIYISSEKVSIVYGGRGSENISIITTDSQGEVWSVGSISKTATHDLDNGYEQMYIDFLDDDRTGYLVAVRSGLAEEKVVAYRSVNSGVTWDHVDSNDTLYAEIIAQFDLQELVL